MVKPFSRNTKLVNDSDEPLKVRRVTMGGIFRWEDRFLTIPPGEHRYMCYADLGIEYNGGRLVEVLFDLGDRQMGPVISTSEIRDHEKIIFFKRNDGTIAHDLIRGSMIQMNGIVISMKGVLKKIKASLMEASAFAHHGVHAETSGPLPQPIATDAPAVHTAVA